MYSDLVCINSIPISIEVKRQANKEGTRAYTAPMVVQKSAITHNTLQVLLNNAVKWSLVCSFTGFIDCCSSFMEAPTVICHRWCTPWQRYNIDWPFQFQPGTGWTVLTTVVCGSRELKYLDICSCLYVDVNFIIDICIPKFLLIMPFIVLYLCNSVLISFFNSSKQNEVRNLNS